MRTRILIMIIPLVLALPALSAEDVIDVEITNRVQRLLDAYAGADDLMDDQLLAKRAELEMMGERAIPALCSILKKKDDPIYQARIIEVFQRADVDSKEPLKAVRSFLITHRDHKYAPAHQAALRYLGAKGEAQVSLILTEYARAYDLVTKTIAEQARVAVEKRIADRAQGLGVTNGAPKDVTK